MDRAFYVLSPILLVVLLRFTLPCYLVDSAISGREKTGTRGRGGSGP